MVDRLEELESSILEILSSILLDPILVEKNKVAFPNFRELFPCYRDVVWIQ